MHPKVKASLDRLLAMTDGSLGDYKDAITDELCALTGSPLSYIAALDLNEQTLTMVGWSKGAMASCQATDRPIVYPLEETGLWGDAVRERKAVITNDYQNLNKPTKKGYPKGHVHVSRHMNLPVFEDGYAVLVVGVGNKASDYTQEDARLLEELMVEVWKFFKEVLWQATW
ncbi:MAG: GAF domain-containing protein [Chloroflexi bacterium]|nr:GAF domain-containing protein [Chloroflexota bacterium]